MRKMLAAAVVSLSVAAGAPPGALARGSSGDFLQDQFAGRGQQQVQGFQQGRGQQAAPFRSPAMVQALAFGDFALSPDTRVAARQALYLVGFAVALDRAWEFLDEDASDQVMASLREAAQDGLPDARIGPDQARDLLLAGAADAEAFARMASPNSPPARRAMRQLAAEFAD